MESYRILPPNCAFRKVLQLVVSKTARILRCRATVCELVHLCNMVQRCPKASTPASNLFSKNADPLRQRAVHRGRGPGGDSDAFITLLNLDGCRTCARETEP